MAPSDARRTSGVNWFRETSKPARGWRCLRSRSSLRCRSGISTGRSPAPRRPFRPALTDADRALAATLAAPQAHSEAAQQQPSDHDTDRHGSDCAICAVLSLANNFLFATPPLLELPQAVELLHLTTGAEFAHLGSLHPAFQSRAPPVS